MYYAFDIPDNRSEQQVNIFQYARNANQFHNYLIHFIRISTLAPRVLIFIIFSQNCDIIVILENYYIDIKRKEDDTDGTE